MRIVVAPDSLKGTVRAEDAARAIATGWRSVRPGDELILVPLADGGEGTVDAFAAAVPAARRIVTTVTGPDGRPVDAAWLLLDDGTAVIELAQSSGLPQMDRLDPLGAHTLGLGEVIAAALRLGARRVVLGLGGSASTDGATGALRALGARFLDRDGRELPLGGGALAALETVETAGLLPPPPGGVQLLCDVTAPLLGTSGAAHTFGPQKGASPDDVAALDGALGRLVEVLGVEPQLPGMGAAGGAAYGFAALWGASTVPGAATVAELAGLPGALATADLVITGEGRFDATSLGGKVVGCVVGLAASAGIPVALVAGSIAGPPPPSIAAAASLTEVAGSVDRALEDAERWLVECGRLLAQRQP